ncbi:MAG TPA: hypothetical protein DF984_03505 [Anaerolineaceae bacterium]|nr:hypothetical protein [Anaerolineaceae bacterium]
MKKPSWQNMGCQRKPWLKSICVMSKTNGKNPGQVMAHINPGETDSVHMVLELMDAHCPVLSRWNQYLNYKSNWSAAYLVTG